MSNNKIIHHNEESWCTLDPSESFTSELNHSMTLSHETITSPYKSNLNTIRKLCKIISDWKKLEKQIE